MGSRVRLVAVFGILVTALLGTGIWRVVGTGGGSAPASVQLSGPNVKVLGEQLVATNSPAPLGPSAGPAGKPSTGTPPPSPGSPAPTNPAKAVIQWVDGQLAPTGDKNTDKDISDAAKALDQSLAGPWSADGNHVASKGGNVVFDNTKSAISDLLKIKAPPAPPPGPPKPPGKPGPSGVYADYINDIDYAVWLVANTAIGDNSCNPAKSPELTAANNELAAGNTQFDQRQFDQAVDHYKNAWTHALNAAGTSCAQPVTLGGNQTGYYPGSTIDLPLTITNPNSFAVTVNALTVTTSDPSNVAGCASTNLTVGSPSPATPVGIAKNSYVVVQVPLTMIPNASNACQGAQFPLTYVAQAVSS